jgi:hypothetical protein
MFLVEALCLHGFRGGRGKAGQSKRRRLVSFGADMSKKYAIHDRRYVGQSFTFNQQSGALSEMTAFEIVHEVVTRRFQDSQPHRLPHPRPSGQG